MPTYINIKDLPETLTTLEGDYFLISQEGKTKKIQKSVLFAVGVATVNASDFNENDTLVIKNSYISGLDPAQMRTLLDTNKISAGTTDTPYLKWNNTTQRWESFSVETLADELSPYISSSATDETLILLGA